MTRATTSDLNDHLFTVQETRRILKASKTHVYDLLNRRELESIKVGRSRRITGASIRRLLGEVA